MGGPRCSRCTKPPGSAVDDTAAELRCEKSSSDHLFLVGFMMAMPRDVEDLRRLLAESRESLLDDADELRKSWSAVKHSLDWREWVARRPWLSLGSAALVGMLVAPRRGKKGPAGAARSSLSAEAVGAEASRGNSGWDLAGTALGFAGPPLLRLLATIAVKQMGEKMSHHGASTSQPDRPQEG